MYVEQELVVLDSVSSCKDTYGEKMIYEVKKNVNI